MAREHEIAWGHLFDIPMDYALGRMTPPEGFVPGDKRATSPAAVRPADRRARVFP